MSDDWSEGYVTEIDYTWGFHRELSPANLAWVAALRGASPPPLDGPFSYCELGCGNALSLNVFAAAHPDASFFGVDFNPNHVTNGQRMAEQGGLTNVKLIERSFADLLGDRDLDRPFDFIVLHGIWSWVNDENRQHITAFLRERLKPGGLVYVSYNALPGWSEMVAVRRLMLDVADRTQGGIEVKVKAAVATLQKFWDTQNKDAVSRSFRNRIERILKSEVSYLAHEYFNKHWALFFFEDVAAALRDAKLSWLTTATLEQTEPSFYLSRQKLAVAREQTDPIDREQMRDFLSNASFRRDVFLKGNPPAELAREPHTSPALLAQIVGPRRSNHQFVAEVKVPAGTLRFPEEHERALFEFFADGPHTVGEALDHLWSFGRTPALALTTLKQMVACDLLRPWVRKPAATAPRHSAERRLRLATPFNQQLIADIIGGRAKKQIVSLPNGGTAIGVSMREAYLLHSLDAVGPNAAVGHAIDALDKAGRRLIVDGRPLQNRREHEEEFGRELDRFQRYKLAHFTKLGVLA